uniref:Uncharacterized protein n=1 Tax=Anguilla anguilla TaxID=7936 RepID=A0A0E9TFS3_ANGAN
MPTPYGERKE